MRFDRAGRIIKREKARRTFRPVSQQNQFQAFLVESAKTRQICPIASAMCNKSVGNAIQSNNYV
jgi:hypothetical protein